MSITYEKSEASFTSVIYEDEVVSFRDFLQEKAGDELSLDFSECEDIHLAVIQLIMAYKKIIVVFISLERKRDFFKLF